MSRREPLDRLYALVANEEDARTCRDISEQACREVPGNFFKIILANVLTKIGDLLINPKTVLAWLIGAVGAPGALAGLLVPIRESGSLIPQLAIGAWMRRHPVRKGFWVFGSVLQGACVLAMAAAVWWLAATVFAKVDEFQGETAGGGHALRQAFESLGLLVSDAPFRDFVIARALLMASALGSPFLVVLAQNRADGAALLGGFLVASSLASTVSASVWGYMADASSRQVMIRGGALAALVCLGVAAVALADPAWNGLTWFYPVAFFVLSIAHSGVRIGRKTYLVDMAGGTKRTDYTAVSNTVIGVLLLVLGGVSAAVSLLGAQWALLLLGAMGVLGTFWSWKLKEVE